MFNYAWNTVTTTLWTAVTTPLVGAGGYALGYGYGTFYQINVELSAKTAAIACMAFNVFENLPWIITGGPGINKRGFFALRLLGDIALGVAFAVAYHQLKIINQLGATIIGAIWGAKTLSDVVMLIK